MLRYLLILVALTLCAVDGLKILVISPVFGRSHSQFLGNLADLYVRNGHDVVYFEPEIVGDDPVLQFNSSKLSRVIKKKKTWEGDHAFAEFQNNGWSEDHNNIFKGFKSVTGFFEGLALSCRDVLNDDALMEQLRGEKFDIAVAEFITVCPYAIYRKIGLRKYITASAVPVGAGFSKLFGVAALPSLAHLPEFHTVSYPRGSFGFRLMNMVSFVFADAFFRTMFLGSILKVINEHYPDLNMGDVAAGSSYIFINANEHIEFVKPTPLKFINIAGIGVPKAKALTEDYQKFMDDATNGVVLVSFGSISQSHMMPKEIKQSFLGAFDEFPQIKFLWKYENASDNIAAGHPNVLTRTWIPQVDILNHKNLIGFITHGGMNSLIESSVYGVPTVCIALFGDQTRNCKMSAHRGLAVLVEKTDVTKETLTEALHELIYNKKYLKQARDVGHMLKKTPMSPEERVLKYTQFAAEFNITENLDDEGRYLSNVVFYNLDVFAFLILVTLTVLFVLFYAVKLVLRLLCRVVKKTKTE